MKLWALAAAAMAPLLSAQDNAPASLAGKSAVVVISNGSGDFASVGGYRISFSPTSPSYAVVPLSKTVSASGGAYSYDKTAPTTGRLTLTDTASGAVVTETLSFTSCTSAVYSIAAPAGSQSGTFVMEDVTAPCIRVGLINLSARTHVADRSPVIPGLVLDSAARVLIRAAGPALAEFGVTAPLPNPKLSLMLGDRAIVTNDDWTSTISNYDAVCEAAKSAGAFPFRFGSRDAALVADLAAGCYTCLITGAPGTSGEVLLEIYRVPR